jgi:ADP-heptose:LPS heptosyltransferase
LLSGAKLRLVHNHSGKDYFTSVPLKIKDGPKSIILRDLETLAPLGLKITDSQMHTQLRIFPAGNDMTQNSPDLPAIGFGVGAKRPAKMWKNEKFIELGKELIIKGYGIVVFCSKKEANDGARIVDVLGDKAKLFDGLDFPELARALKRVSLFVGNDSGLRHMAAALNVKTVTLFGPEDPVEWHPYLEKDGHIAVMHRLDCVNCAENDCPKGSHECMELITVDEVMDAVKRLL